MTRPLPLYSHDGIEIYHGDCRDILPTIEPGSVDLVLTDPPYGVSFDTDFTRFTGGVSADRSTHPAVAGDDEPFDPALLMGIGRRVVLFGANAFSDRLPCGTWLVWDKRSINGSKNVMSDAEVAWVDKGHGVYIYSHSWDGFNRATERGTAFHPTQKPVALMQWVLDRFSKPGDLVLDPYMGSGPVAVACQKTGRRYIGIEINLDYCITAGKRLNQLAMNLEVA